MDDLTKILLTIFGSFVVFVAGQVFVRFYIDPVLETRKVVGEIIFALTIYANVYTDPHRPGSERDEERKEAARSLRELSGRLRGQAYAVVWYGLAEGFGLLPSLLGLYQASQSLIGLSNNCYRGHPVDGERLRSEITNALFVASRRKARSLWRFWR